MGLTGGGEGCGGFYGGGDGDLGGGDDTRGGGVGRREVGRRGGGDGFRIRGGITSGSPAYTSCQSLVRRRVLRRTRGGSRTAGLFTLAIAGVSENSDGGFLRSERTRNEGDRKQKFEIGFLKMKRQLRNPSDIYFKFDSLMCTTLVQKQVFRR